MITSHLFQSKFAAINFPEMRSLCSDPIATSKTFVAIPSLGSLVEGWVLIVPRRESLCVGSFSDLQISELKEFTEEMVLLLENQYGHTVIFEHGPAEPSKQVGCGVDYAHIHLVPTTCNIFNKASSVEPQIQWHPVKGFYDLRTIYNIGQSYLYLDQRKAGELPMIGLANEIPSQFFRRILADWIGKSDCFDWKSFPNFQNMRNTRSTLENIKTISPQLVNC